MGKLCLSDVVDNPSLAQVPYMLLKEQLADLASPFWIPAEASVIVKQR